MSLSDGLRAQSPASPRARKPRSERAKWQEKRWKLRNADHASRASSAYYRSKHDEVKHLLGDKCFLCEQTKPRMEVHHLTYPNGVSLSPWQRYKEAKANPENFRLLCHPCHRIVSMIPLIPGMQDRLNLVVLLGKGKQP